VTTGNSALDGVALNQSIQHLRISGTPQQFGGGHFEYLLQHVLYGHPALKRVMIDIRQEWDNEEEAYEGFEPLEELICGLGHEGVQTNLLFFVVECVDPKTSHRMISVLFQEWWDQNVVPTLALNWYYYEQD
jgi:hypothetical protein